MSQGRAISSQLYIKNALEKINEINNLLTQVNADNLFLKSNIIVPLQNKYDLTKHSYNKL